MREMLALACTQNTIAWPKQWGRFWPQYNGLAINYSFLINDSDSPIKYEHES